jgi:hypothetical protein
VLDGYLNFQRTVDTGFKYMLESKHLQFQFFEKNSESNNHQSQFKFIFLSTCDFHERIGEELMGFWPAIFLFFDFENHG